LPIKPLDKWANRRLVWGEATLSTALSYFAMSLFVENPTGKSEKIRKKHFLQSPASPLQSMDEQKENLRRIKKTGKP